MAKTKWLTESQIGKKYKKGYYRLGDPSYVAFVKNGKVKWDYVYKKKDIKRVRP